MIKVIHTDLHIFNVKNLFPKIYDTMLNNKIKTLYLIILSVNFKRLYLIVT